ncbi:MAG: TIGR03503 family protein [Gammaproteobacteria bacterium]|nr:TIGR03503 family protein [Gammaproteobacteria bacterium]
MKLNNFKRLSLWFLYFVTFTIMANPPLVNPSTAENAAKLELLKSVGGNNEIRLLNNRFRVDYEVEEVMMVFFRKRGSSPIVLVRPDGSKLYPKDANGNELEWHADISYDLIKLKSPMPGPWQAVGRILPDSKIMIISDIELQADLLPSTVFQYEKIKAKARVINADQIVRERNFRSVVTLKASLYPSSDSSQDNFGSDIHQFGEFLDNGKGLDERPRDGEFTIEYDLSVGNGEWLPKYWLNTELFSRELTQEPITVLPTPIIYEEELAADDGRYHYVTINVDDTLVDDNSMVFTGEIKFPNGDIQTFNIEGLQSRRLQIFNSEYGTYSITTQAFGTTKEGREFVMALPAHQFLVRAPLLEETTQIELPEMTDMSEPEVVEQKAPEPEFPLALVILVNVMILIIGFLVIWLFVLKRDIPNPFARFFNKKAMEEEEIAPLPKQEKPAKKVEERKESDDILDLSLPED